MIPSLTLSRNKNTIFLFIYHFVPIHCVSLSHSLGRVFIDVHFSGVFDIEKNLS